MVRRRKFLAMLLALAGAPRALAHNNAGYEKTVVLRVDVAANPDAEGRNAAAFQLELPKNALQLFYEIESDEADSITFSVESGDRFYPDLKSGDKTRLLRDPVTIKDVKGATSPFVLQIIVEVLVR